MQNFATTVDLPDIQDPSGAELIGTTDIPDERVVSVRRAGVGLYPHYGSPDDVQYDSEVMEWIYTDKRIRDPLSFVQSVIKNANSTLGHFGENIGRNLCTS